MRHALALLTWVAALFMMLCAGTCSPMRDAYADTPAPLYLRTREPTLLCALISPDAPADAQPRCRELPAGRFLAEPGWSALDLEMRRLQDAETRLTAENTSLRKNADAWRPGWKTLTGAVLVGVALGVAATR